MEGRRLVEAELGLLCCEGWMAVGSGKDEVEVMLLVSSVCGDCKDEEAEEAGASDGARQVAERRRVFGFCGSDRLAEELASEDWAELFLNMVAAPNELTRRRMPRLEGGSVELDDRVGEGAEMEGESGIGIERKGRPKLEAAPEALCLEVSVMVCTVIRSVWIWTASREMRPDGKVVQTIGRDIGVEAAWLIIKRAGWIRSRNWMTKVESDI